MTVLDLVALGWFVVVWGGYSLLVDRSRFGKRGLSAVMNGYRRHWMQTMLTRENRIVDAAILTGLQNGTAFLASTALLAIGGSLAFFNAADDAMALFEVLPFGRPLSRPDWEVRCLGLTIIFVYAFFKFAWSLRLFNYASIILGAVPHHESDKDAQALATRAGELIAIAGRHFNNGQRAFFFALGFLGWFVSSWLFMLSTALVAVVLARRQFLSNPLDAVRS